MMCRADVLTNMEPIQKHGTTGSHDKFLRHRSHKKLSWEESSRSKRFLGEIHVVTVQSV